MADLPRHEVTLLIQNARRGDEEAVGKLFPVVYEELREIARNRFRKERQSHTL